MKKLLPPLFALAAASALADTPITDRAGLAAIAANAESLAGSYTLGADIDLGGADWTPLGTDSAPFTGEFHGNGHAIRNLVCTNNPSGNSCRGLFGCASNATIDSVSVDTRNRYAGLFGKIAGGRVCGVQAEGDVTGSYEGSGSDVGVGGFAGFVASSARIAASWCSGQVDATDTYRGAFVGQANGTGLISDSYYDTSANGQMEASGTSSPRGFAAYAGVTPLDADDMTDKASFPAFDFIDTWIITEADGAPMLRTFFSAYELWLKDAGIAYEPEPDELVNGIPAGARYVFGIDPLIGPANLSEPLIDIGFDTNGVPFVKLPALVNDEGATVTVLATGDLSGGTPPDEFPVDRETGVCVPDLGDPLPDRAFFKYRIEIED